MARLDQKLREESPARKLKEALRSILLFPRLVSKKYARYNIGLREMISSFGDKTAETVWTQNVKRVNMFIRIPLTVGFLTGALLCYVNSEELKSQIKQTRIPLEVSLIKHRKTPSKWVQFRPEKFKVSFVYIGPFLVGYLLSSAGAVFLSLNPAFKKEKVIQQALISQKYLYDTGEPWDVVWTPYGILFYAYNCDPNAVHKNVRFWNSINFKPDDPKISPRDANVFLIKKAYDLPDSILLNVSPIIKSKQNDEAKKLETEVKTEIEDVEEDSPEKFVEEVLEAASDDVPEEVSSEPEEVPKAETKGFLGLSKQELQEIARAAKISQANMKRKKEYPYTPKPVPTLTAEDLKRLKEKKIISKTKSGF